MKGFSNRLTYIEEYYFSKKLKEVRQLISEGKPVINMGIGSPDLPPHPSVIKALQDTASDSLSHGYQGYQGIPELRKAFADFYQKYYGVDLNPNAEILPLMGSKEGIVHISMAFLNAGDEVLIPNPGYPTYASAVQLVEAKAVFYDLDKINDWQPNFAELKKNDLSKVKLMWVNYPHMPTGARANQDLFEKIIQFGKKHNILIIHDNPYSFILEDKPSSILSINGAKEIALELNSLSKTANMAGWRVGALVGKAELVDAVLKVKSNMDSGMFLGIQKGAIAALSLGQDWYASLNETYGKRRNLVWELADLLDLEVEKEAVGMFVWAKIKNDKTDIDFVDELLDQHHLFITPGSVFGSQGKGYVRFSLCISEKKIEEVINRIK
ncbi:aspartate/tyrosine/aromatic aminotransferase [Belliella baltica DSM 15883]|uniref:Aminotransferase n=1 Tax=Belliella baltica (strain DSM 15883 / CIP 108006 / LMG 21964 / BA134) TaxID=866536 RepID=I3Z6H6_BELBD|nr:aminotransferase class I/II-fold pyridoxal phosphate-dependent enzyme [Belliella baltica]AFL84844.1 aspartate/tyrosine/aromatic aminotransferase [Belliella baltica DSM 15883]